MIPIVSLISSHDIRVLIGILIYNLDFVQVLLRVSRQGVMGVILSDDLILENALVFVIMVFLKL